MARSFGVKSFMGGWSSPCGRQAIKDSRDDLHLLGGVMNCVNDCATLRREGERSRTRDPKPLRGALPHSLVNELRHQPFAATTVWESGHEFVRAAQRANGP